MGKAYFVSGIDTGIGKTAVTGLMARWLASQRRDVITVKMVQTGNDGFSEDLDMHRAIMGAGKFREDLEGLTAPQIFKFSRLCHFIFRKVRFEPIFTQAA